MKEKIESTSAPGRTTKLVADGQSSTMRITTKLFCFLFPALLAAQCPPAGTRVVLAVDQSGSIIQDERGQWRPPALQLADCVGPGGQLEVWAVTSNTANDAPILSSEFPLQTSHTVANTRRFIALRNDFHAQAKHAIEFALEHTAPGETDLFSMITRAAHDGPPGLLALFTDGLNSVDPNLERLAIHDKEIPTLVQTVAQKHRWSGRTLAGTKVYIILPGGAKQIGPNNRETLELFYRVLCEALGGSLARFDTHL